MDFLQSFLEFFKSLFIIIDGLLIFGFIVALKNAMAYRPNFVTRRPRRIITIRRAVVLEQWQSVRRKYDSGHPDSIRLAVIEADKVVDNILKQAGYPGEHMADRLARLPGDQLSSLSRLWRAHRFRNQLVHSPDYQPEPEQASQAMEGYESFLREIKIL
jgi:hypothetical protein